jgi:hypothetical protein
MRVPDFLVRQFYVAGSLRNEGDGFRIEARNGMGDGHIVGIGQLSVDGREVDLSAVTATRSSDPTPRRATELSPTSPVPFSRGDVVTIHVAGRPLTPGPHRFEVEVFERDAGSLQLSLTDTVRD